MQIGLINAKGYGRKRIEAELELCDLVCANCHRIRTHKEEGS